MKDLIEFFFRLFPPYPLILAVLGVVFLLIAAAAYVAGALKRYAGWKTGYTRKLLHFIVFFSAAGLHLWGGMPAVNVLGIGMGVFVLLAVRAGDGNFFFEAMAREKDFPRKGYFIIVPYLSTALGGLCANFLFGSSAVMGYIICGAADAVAEPVGVRFGKHVYRVPSLRRVKVSERSIEGSLSILVVSLVFSFFFFSFFYGMANQHALAASALLSLVVVFVEAFSFHGADNFTIQVTAAGMTELFLILWG
jgi:phytol kinase